jgi:hypothetical protein
MSTDTKDKDIEKAFDTAHRFVEQMRDDHRPMAMYTALRAVLDVVEKLKPQPEQPVVDPVPTPLPPGPPPSAGQLPAGSEASSSPGVPPTTTKAAKH